MENNIILSWLAVNDADNALIFMDKYQLFKSKHYKDFYWRKHYNKHKTITYSTCLFKLMRTKNRLIIVKYLDLYQKSHSSINDRKLMSWMNKIRIPISENILVKYENEIFDFMFKYINYTELKINDIQNNYKYIINIYYMYYSSDIIFESLINTFGIIAIYNTVIIPLNEISQFFLYDWKSINSSKNLNMILTTYGIFLKPYKFDNFNILTKTSRLIFSSSMYIVINIFGVLLNPSLGQYSLSFSSSLRHYYYDYYNQFTKFVNKTILLYGKY
jgi:hypothetical protein